MATQWFTQSRDDPKRGPFSDKELKARAASGLLTPNHFVWKEGLQRWVSATKIKGLFDVVSAAPQSSAAPIATAAAAGEDPFAAMIELARQSPSIPRPVPTVPAAPPDEPEDKEKRSFSLPVFAVVLIVAALAVSAGLATVCGVTIASFRLQVKAVKGIVFIIGFVSGWSMGKLIRIGGLKTDFHGYLFGGLAGVTATYFYWAAQCHVALVGAAPEVKIPFLRTISPDVMMSYLSFRMKEAGGLGFLGLLFDAVVIIAFAVGVTVVVCTDFKVKPDEEAEAQAAADELMRHFR